MHRRLASLVGLGALALTAGAFQGTDEDIVDVISREVSVLAPPPETSTSIVSREVSVLTGPTEFAVADVVSREVSVKVGASEFPITDVISREVSVLAPSADLVASTPTAPTSAVAGDSIDVSWSVLNLGGAPASAPWNDVVVLSVDQVVGNGDDEIIVSVAQLRDLGVGAWYPRADSGTIPVDIAGAYWVFVVPDYQNDVFELDGEDNAVAAPQQIQITPFPEPDLAVTVLAPPPVAIDGEPAQVSWTVENVGTDDAGGVWVDRVYLSADSQFDGVSTDPSLGVFPSLGAGAPGESYTRSATVIIPPGLNGDYWFIVRADDTDAITNESDESNNLVVAAAPTLVYQPDLPDLEVTGLSLLPDVPERFINDEVTVTWTVENTDPDGTASGTWTDRVYLSSDGVLDRSDPEVGSGGFSGTRAPGESYLQNATLSLPPTGGMVWVFVVADADEAIEEADEVNAASVAIDVLEPSYTANAQTDFVEGLARESFADPYLIPITGQALDIGTGLPVPDVDVTVRVRHKQTRRVYPLTTDGNGDFPAGFGYSPLVGEAGLFELYSDHPSAIEDPGVDPAQDSFVLYGLRANPGVVYRNLLTGDTYDGQVALTNVGDTPVSGITVSASAPPAYLGFDNLQWPATLGPGEVGAIAYRLSGLSDPPPRDAPAQVDLQISIPVNGQLEVAETVQINAQVTPLFPELAADVTSVSGSATSASQAIATIEVSNIGGAIAQDLRIEVSSSPECQGLVSIITPSELAALNPFETTGETWAAEVAFTPGNELPVDSVCGGSIDFYIGARSQPALSVPYQFTVTSTATGSVSVRVEDEFTYWALDGTELNGTGPLVANASVVLRKPNTSPPLVYQATTDASGIVSFSRVLEGYYYLQVSAPDHGSFSMILHVNPGQETPAVVFLPRQAVSYDWTVVPTTIEDEYRITITAIFETFVPVPNIKITPGVVQLDLAPGETDQVLLNVFNDSFIAARGMELVHNAIPGYEITPLITEIGDLGAMQSIDIPVIIHRPTSAFTASCGANVTWGLKHYIVCGQPRWYWTPIYWQYPVGECGGGVAGGWAPGGGGGSGGSSSDPYYWQPTYDIVVNCQPPPEQTPVPPPPCPPFQCCKPVASDGPPPARAGDQTSDGNTNGVNYATGEADMTVEDMSIPGRGMDFPWRRRYLSKRAPQSVLGVGWDFEFNMSLGRLGPDVVLREGNGRVDKYEPAPDGTWCRQEQFRAIDRNPDGTYWVLFPDLSRWEFHPVGPTALSGRLHRVVDRNGNRFLCNYDGTGRLQSITDTLDRDITLAYNADGYIESLTDFAGRQVRYEYYEDGDAGGGAGDLKSVTTPSVTGTPNGNDFPQGKTTVYTYSTGFAEPALNHNLLTVTDPKGQVYLQNEYHRTTEPHNRDFDRVIRQTWGDVGDDVGIYYVPIVPTLENGYAVIITIVNDREGNVSEYDYDIRNRLVAKREFTGRADPDQPTSLVSNRPMNPLRPTDPFFWETTYGWNADSLLTRVDLPNGNYAEYVYESTLFPATSARLRANLRELHRRPGVHLPVGDQPELTEYFEYDPDGGGCCGSNWVTRYESPDGDVTQHEYDAAGNRLRTIHAIPTIIEEWEYNGFGQMTAHIWPDNGSSHKQRDEFHYYGGGFARGYLEQVVQDVGGFELTRSYEYSPTGNRTREIDPRGNDTLRVYNALDQLLEELSRPVSVESGVVRYRRGFAYDANDNLVSIAVENRGGDGLLDIDHPLITTSLAYDTLNQVLSKTEEVSATEAIVTAYEYDALRNRTLLTKGVATSGADPNNVVAFVHDERDLLYQRVRAPGHPDQSSTQCDYDGNRNLVRLREGVEDTAQPHWTTNVHDAFERLVSSTDAMGNVRSWEYDADGNRTRERIDGQLTDVSGSAGNLRLYECEYEFDALERMKERRVAFFDTQTQGTIDDGSATTTYEYSDRSDVLTVTDDNGHATLTSYDTVGRPLTETDPRGNTRTHAYDANSNAIASTEVDLSDLGNPPETFVTTYTYDSLDRLEASTDNIGNTMMYVYDSRGNLVQRIDALGNVVDYTFDGLGRTLETIRRMTDTGVGGGAPLDPITTRKVWDASSRLVGQQDDNGGLTGYVYDALDRRTAVVYADFTQDTVVYDVHDNAVQTADANGSIVALGYDLVDRVVRKDVTPGAGVSDDTTFEAFEYDGRSRLNRAEDDDSVVLRNHDSLSSVIAESQNGAVVATVYDGVRNPEQCTYPGGRVVSNTFDELDRRSSTSDQDGPIAAFDYIGASRTERITFANDTAKDWAYDGIRRVVGTSLTTDFSGAGTVLDQRAYSWDAMSNKTGIVHQLEPWERVFGYDSAYRLVQSMRIEASVVTEAITYVLDGVGNRTEVQGGTDPGAYVVNYPMNQYAETPFDERLHDACGNLIKVDDEEPTQRVGVYDFRNRLAEWSDLAVGEAVHYRYDCLGRRTHSESSVGSTTTFLYHGWQVCEERDGLRLAATYVYGSYLDELLSMARAGADWYCYSDDLFSVLAVSDESGSLAEAFEYSDYGLPLDSADWSELAGRPSSIGIRYFFTGREYEPLQRSYYYRTRYFAPRVGRFESRDTLGIWGDPAGVGNSSCYTGNSPYSGVDPMGEERKAPVDVSGEDVCFSLEGAKFDCLKDYQECMNSAFNECGVPAIADVADDTELLPTGYFGRIWTLCKLLFKGRPKNCVDPCVLFVYDKYKGKPTKPGWAYPAVPGAEEGR